MLHAILHKSKLVGIFSNYHKCKIMLEGLISNNFAIRTNLEIKSYYENSITSGEYNEETYESENNDESSNILEEFTDTNTTDTPQKEEKIHTKVPNEDEIKKKAEIQNSIFELKKKKEKLEESKRVYEVDVDLYKKFKKIKETNDKFEIPEMFIEKYLLKINDNKFKENNLSDLISKFFFVKFQTCLFRFTIIFSIYNSNKSNHNLQPLLDHQHRHPHPIPHPQ